MVARRVIEAWGRTASPLIIGNVVTWLGVGCLAWTITLILRTTQGIELETTPSGLVAVAAVLEFAPVLAMWCSARRGFVSARAVAPSWFAFPSALLIQYVLFWSRIPSNSLWLDSRSPVVLHVVVGLIVAGPCFGLVLDLLRGEEIQCKRDVYWAHGLALVIMTALVWYLASGSPTPEGETGLNLILETWCFLSVEALVCAISIVARDHLVVTCGAKVQGG